MKGKNSKAEVRAARLNLKHCRGLKLSIRFSRMRHLQAVLPQDLEQEGYLLQFSDMIIYNESLPLVDEITAVSDAAKANVPYESCHCIDNVVSV